MSRRLILPALGAAVAALLAPLSAAPAQKAAAAPRDWTRTVVVTPEGGFRMGNPNAKVKLIEYGSMTCPHCAEFAQGAKGPIAAHVRSGRVSFEFRNFVLNGVDVTATLLARCAGPANFFRLTDSLFTTQSQWVGKIGGLSEAEKDKLKSLTSGQRLGRLADIGGLTQIAARAGVAPQRGKQCLADDAGLARLGQMAEAATALGVQGTPTFFVNGSIVHAHSWAELEPAIRSAGG
jgi:protein-disulfide isomerase